jgi:hypothetical protein
LGVKKRNGFFEDMIVNEDVGLGLLEGADNEGGQPCLMEHMIKWNSIRMRKITDPWESDWPNAEKELSVRLKKRSKF